MKKTNNSGTDFAVAVAVVAVLGPAYVHISPASLIVVSMMWQIVFGITIIPIFEPMFLAIIIPFTFMRLIVPISVFRLYQNKTTVRRVLLIVLGSEIQPILLYDIPLLVIATLQGLFPFFLPFIIPIPFLALIVLLILKFYPPPKHETDWIKESEQPSWIKDHSLNSD